MTKFPDKHNVSGAQLKKMLLKALLPNSATIVWGQIFEKLIFSYSEVDIATFCLNKPLEENLAHEYFIISYTELTTIFCIKLINFNTPGGKYQETH